ATMSVTLIISLARIITLQSTIFFFNDPPTPEIYTLSLHDALPISVAASSAIPGFFEPYALRGRDYVDGGVGFSGHADLAAEAGADVVIVVNPLVPNPDGGVVPLRNRGLYTIMEQAGRIYSQNLLQLGLS